MTDLSTYTTSELERLVSLTAATTRINEYITFADITQAYWKVETIDGYDLVQPNGHRASSTRGTYGPVTPKAVRRVRSFTDLTEVDPSVDAMKRELERRREMDAAASNFIAGQRVMCGGKSYTVARVMRPATNGALLVLHDTGIIETIVRPQDVALIMTPQPIPGQVYRHRETTDERPHDGRYGSSFVLARYDGNSVWSVKFSYTEAFKADGAGVYACNFTAEVAAGRYVPYTPPAISNATHAGRRVHVAASPHDYRDVSGNGIVLSARAREVVRAGFDTIGDKYGRSRVAQPTVVVALDKGTLLEVVAHSVTLLD